MTKIILVLLTFFNISYCFASNFEANTTYDVCFTPNQNCTAHIVQAINQSQKELLVQAYSFTSVPIARALVDASKRGVKVKLILDKSQYKPKGYSSAKFFTNQHIPVWLDYRPNIAHSKIMIIDEKTVVTGSFNFTKAAQERNTENVLIINDAKLANTYRHNWLDRLSASRSLQAKKAVHHEAELPSDLSSEIQKLIKIGKKFFKLIKLD